MIHYLVRAVPTDGPKDRSISVEVMAPSKKCAIDVALKVFSRYPQWDIPLTIRTVLEMREEVIRFFGTPWNPYDHNSTRLPMVMETFQFTYTGSVDAPGYTYSGPALTPSNIHGTPT